MEKILKIMQNIDISTEDEVEDEDDDNDDNEEDEEDEYDQKENELQIRVI